MLESRRAATLLDRPDVLRRLLASMVGYEYCGSTDMSVPRGRNRCGPVVMQIVLRQNGIEVPFEVLEQELMDRPEGTSVRRMKEVAERYGFRALARRVSLAEVAQIPLPSIALYKRRHYVVLEALVHDGYCILIDPAIGRVRAPASRFLQDCNGEMLLIRRES